jgi:hypothetical protein
MTSKVRSARGEVVDFALLEMKSQLAKQQAPVDVQVRKSKIETTKPVYVEEPEEIQSDDGIIRNGIVNQTARKVKK